MVSRLATTLLSIAWRIGVTPDPSLPSGIRGMST
jgi:hypothetical protein